MIVYFDTNVFDHFIKGVNVSNSEQNALRDAINADRVSIVFSYLNLEEILSVITFDPVLARVQLRFILEVADKRKFAKPANMLLEDEIRCYADGQALPSPFLEVDDFTYSELRQLSTGSRASDAILQIIKDTLKEKEDFVSTMKQTQEEVVPYAKALLRETDGQAPEWNSYWDRLAIEFTKGFAARVDLESCISRGIAGLLDVRSIRMAVGSSLSFFYGQTFEKRTSHKGDSRDLQHAVVASIADVFVTHDRSLARLLARIPRRPVQIMDVQKLLKLVMSRS